MKKILELAEKICNQNWVIRNEVVEQMRKALVERRKLESTPITEDWLKEHGFVRNKYRNFKYDLTMNEGRTEIHYYRSGGGPTSTMSVYKNIDFEDEVCYELPEPYFVAQMLDALELCNIEID